MFDMFLEKAEYLLVYLSCVVGGLIFSHYILRKHPPNDLSLSDQCQCKPLRHRYPQLPWLLGLDVVYHDWRNISTHKASKQAAANHSRFGTTFSTSIGGKQTIHTIEPKNIITVTTSKFGDYEKADWTKEIAKHMGNGILVNDGPDWEASRTMLKPLFRRNRSSDIRMFEIHVNRLLPWLDQRKMDYVDFKRVASMLTLDITTEMLFGKSTETLKTLEAKTGHFSEAKPNLLNLIEELEPYGNLAMEFGIFALVPMILRYRKIIGLVRGIQLFFAQGIAEKKHSEAEGRPLSNDPKATKQETSDALELMVQRNLPRQQIQGELQNIFFAAYDTTTALLTNLFDTLGRLPEVCKKLQMEIDFICPRERTPNEVDISRMQYLRAVIHEAIRLYSPVTNHVRKACRDTVLPSGGGEDGESPLLIRKGQAVSWNTYALNRRRDIYGADSLNFRPERWLERETGIGDVFMPFGTGPRNCLGQQFAMLQISYVTVRLLQFADAVDLKDRRPFQEAKAVTFFNGRGTWIKFGVENCTQ